MTRQINVDKMTELIFELLKDCNRSDRDFAKVLKVSQPTISRMRKKIVEEKMVLGFSAIPNFYSMGYRLMVITLVKNKHNFASTKTREEGFNKVQKWMMSKPNVVFCDFCRGMGMNGIMISFHKSYEEFDTFMTEHNNKLGSILNDTQNIIVNLGEHKVVKPFHFSYLSEDL